MHTTKRVLSGIQPSGEQVHLGNYLGAMKKFVSLSKENDTFVCIVDYHALTSVSNGEDLRRYTRSLAAAYLAVGLDPEKATLYKQSDIPAVCELCWCLATVFPLGLLERGHAIKDARARYSENDKQANINSGLLFYPILMAADILLYKATHVPVGADQKQHLEMARDVAVSFNHKYGETFPLPEPVIDQTTGVIPGLDGRKMSKSYNNFIGLFEKPEKLKKQVRSIVTNSQGVEEVKDPDNCNVFNLYKLFANADEQSELRERYLSGNMGWGIAKDELFRVIDREVSPFRDRYEDLMQNPAKLKEILDFGATKAKKLADQTMEEVKTKLGLN